MYRATAVKDVDLGRGMGGREGQGAVVGFDVGKRRLLAVVRWEDGRFERPRLVENPGEVPVLVGLLKHQSAGRGLRLAMEPTRTYGEALRQALSNAGLPLSRLRERREGASGFPRQTFLGSATTEAGGPPRPPSGHLLLPGGAEGRRGRCRRLVLRGLFLPSWTASQSASCARPDGPNRAKVAGPVSTRRGISRTPAPTL